MSTGEGRGLLPGCQVGMSQLRQGVFDRRDVGATEQVHVRDQEIELVERHARLVAGGQRKGFVVGGKDPRPEAAEEVAQIIFGYVEG